MHLLSPPAPSSTAPITSTHIDSEWVEREIGQAPTLTSDGAALLSRLLWPNGDFHLVLAEDQR